MAELESGAGPGAWNSVFYGLAGGVSLSRAAAELPGARHQERRSKLADGFTLVWIFTYHEWRVSELAIRDSGLHRRIFLRVDVAEDGIDFCVSAGARGGGCLVAFFVSSSLGG